MNFPFVGTGPNTETLRTTRRFLGRGGRDHVGELDEYDERQQLSPRGVGPPDLEAQSGPAEMAERPSPSSRFLGRFSRPAIPSFLSTATSSRHRPAAGDSSHSRARPSSSHYSGEGQDGAESPKTPRFTLSIPNLPSARLHLPNLSRTWTQNSSTNSPPSPGTTSHAHRRPSNAPQSRGTASVDGREPPAQPAPAYSREHGRTRGSEARGAREEPEMRERTRTRFHGADPAERHLAELAEEGRRRRDRRHRRHDSDRSRGSREGDVESGTRRRRRSDRDSPPKHFLFCFPWVQSRRMRTQILRCFVSGLFLALVLTVYLSLTITKILQNSEFTVMLILILLFVTIFFCHALVRLCLQIVRGPPADEDSDSTPRPDPFPQLYAPGGYAVPQQPIQVVLARDEEAAGIESEATKSRPPAYGLWRESVRVDPNRIFWVRNENASGSGSSSNSSSVEEDRSESDRHDGSSDNSDERGGPATRRPPSYASDDGVEYVVEARPRSVAPVGPVPVAPHPSEVGRAGEPSQW